MDYKTLKNKVRELKEHDGDEVVLEKDVAIQIMEEVLTLRRRNTAKCRQGLAVPKTSK